MITKSYSVMCDCCTKSEELFSQTLKECEAEAKETGWVKINKNWYCEECYKDVKLNKNK